MPLSKQLNFFYTYSFPYKSDWSTWLSGHRPLASNPMVTGSIPATTLDDVGCSVLWKRHLFTCTLSHSTQPT